MATFLPSAARRVCDIVSLKDKGHSNPGDYETIRTLGNCIYSPRLQQSRQRERQDDTQKLQPATFRYDERPGGAGGDLSKCIRWFRLSAKHSFVIGL
eukprot:scaffold40975_cov41-Attheya_sp.AAC.1